MKIDRAQSVVTKDGNDVVSVLANSNCYRKVQIDPSKAGSEEVIRMKFHEGSYSDCIEGFNVAPYLSAYMLGYSKMLMQASFQHIVEIGAMPLYTDTDSIGFKATPEQWTLYEERFVPLKKTFGGMELEGRYSRLLAIGPKKYICQHQNGDYEWHANGIPARSNAHADILAKFERVLKGDVEDTDYFSITAGKDFELRHTTGATKKLRFICLKGKLEGEGEDLRITWWKNFEEFQQHAQGLRPIGWDLVIPHGDEAVSDPEPKSKVAEWGEIQEVHHKSKKRKAPESTEQDQFVYIIKTSNDDGDSRVGYTTELAQRLRQHNGELAGGADTTRGRQWIYHQVYSGFLTKNEALSFEAILQNKTVQHYSEWDALAEDLIQNKFPHVKCGV